jgi:glycosyltransferase involved in cell wall biosynthesis
MKISLITPTGGRPVAFELCELWMSRQTVQPDEWIVVDDYEIPTKCTMGQKIIRRTPFWKPGDVTLSKNLIAALKIVTGDIVLIIEDDDWYSPYYIENMLKFLKNYDLVGESMTPYYNIKDFSYYKWSNVDISALFRTGFTRQIKKQIECVLNFSEKVPIDFEIWTHCLCKKLIIHNKNLSCGIKEIPGRPHIIGMSTVSKKKSFDKIPFRTLEMWIGKDVEFYKKISNE